MGAGREVTAAATHDNVGRFVKFLFDFRNIFPKGLRPATFFPQLLSHW